MRSNKTDTKSTLISRDFCKLTYKIFVTQCTSFLCKSREKWLADCISCGFDTTDWGKLYMVSCTDLRPSKRHAMQIYLENVDVPRLLDTVETCAEKVSLFENILKTGLDFITPPRSKTIHRSEPPWLNDKLKNLIKRR